MEVPSPPDFKTPATDAKLTSQLPLQHPSLPEFPPTIFSSMSFSISFNDSFSLTLTLGNNYHSISYCLSQHQIRSHFYTFLICSQPIVTHSDLSSSPGKFYPHQKQPMVCTAFLFISQFHLKLVPEVHPTQSS